jgi:hypothetical protein
MAHFNGFHAAEKTSNRRRFPVAALLALAQNNPIDGTL